MQMRRFPLIAVIVTFLFQVLPLGCSSDDAGNGADGSTPNNDAGTDVAQSPDGPTAPPTASDYCERIAGFFCGFYLRCDRIVEKSAEACEKTFLEICNEVYEPRYQALEQAGLLQLSEVGVAQCEAHLALVPCDEQLMDLAGPCSEMWQGRSNAGSPCGLDIEGFVCDESSTCRLELSLCGECVAAAKSNESCGETVSCVYPDKCVGGACAPPSPVGGGCTGRNCILGASCVNGTCVARTYVSVGAACDATHRCVYRSQCVGGTCVYAALLGESCASQTPCASGHCEQGACASFKPPGQPCTAKEQCLSNSCEGGVCGSLISSCLKP